MRRPETGDPPGSLSSLVRVMRQAAPMMSAAWSLSTALAAGALGGWWLDGRWGTSPWLVLIGSLAGAALGLYLVARAMRARVE